MPPPCDSCQPARRPGRDAAAQGGPRARPPATFQVVLAAEPAAPSLVRDRLREWLAVHQWPDTEVTDLLIAVSEAVSNVVDHAYPPGVTGNIEINGRVAALSGGAQLVELTVRDSGRWRPPPGRREYRRRGIPLMRAAVEALVINGTNQGTCVRMRSRVVGR